MGNNRRRREPRMRVILYLLYSNTCSFLIFPLKFVILISTNTFICHILMSSTIRPKSDGSRGSGQEEQLGAERLLRTGKRVFLFRRPRNRHPGVPGCVRCSDLAWGTQKHLHIQLFFLWILIMRILFLHIGGSFVPVLGEQPATSESHGQSRAWDRRWDWAGVHSGQSAWYVNVWILFNVSHVLMPSYELTESYKSNNQNIKNHQ